MSAYERARADALAARQRLESTAAKVKGELAPASLADAAKSAARARSGKIATAALLVARRHPAAAIGVALASALYMFRKPVAAIWRRRKTRETDDERTD